MQIHLTGMDCAGDLRRQLNDDLGNESHNKIAPC